MAKEGLGGLITIAAVGGIGYWLYSSGMLSGLFGSSAPAAPASTPPGTNLTPSTTTPVTAQPPATPAAPPPTPPAPPTCNGSNILAPLLASVQKAQGSTFGTNLPGTLNIDQWDWYLDQLCTGMSKQYKITADDLYPGDPDRGGPLNWNAFYGAAKAAGLSGCASCGVGAAPGWAGRSPTVLPPGLRRTLPAKARARGRRTVPRTIGTNPVLRRVA